MTRAALATFASAATALGLVPASAGALTLAVTTKSPQDVGTTSATMRADVTVSVLGANVTWQYGTTTSYGASTAGVSSGLLGVNQTLTLPVAGLAPNTTYHVRAVANGGLTTSYGRDVSFTTDRAASSGSGSGSGSGAGGSGSGASGSGSGSGSGTGTTTAPSAGTDTGADTTTTGKAPTSSSSTTTSTGKGSSDDDVTRTTAADGAASADPAAAIAPGAATAAVAPVLGRTLAIAAVQGTVTATSPTGAPLDLSAAQAVPNGTLIDTRGGTVELTSALDRKGATQTARFWGALFEVHQGTLARGLTQIVLRGADFSSCATSSYGKVARAATAAKKKAKKPVRTLWGSDDHGRFQTKGRGSVATVRGTRWMTRDTCAGTLTRVAVGAVAVKDLRRGRTVIVQRGHEYLARADR